MLSTEQNVIAVWREPFALKSPTVENWEDGKTIAEAVKTAQYLPKGFSQFGQVQISGHEIPRNLWHMVKPRPSKSGAFVAVTFHMPVKGGKKGGMKQVFALVAALALTFATQGILAGKLAPFLGKAFAAGTMGSKLLAAGVSVVGGLVVNSLTSVPTRAETGAETVKALEPASVQGNVLRANSPIPCVIGTRKVFPPFLSEPIVELQGQDEYVTATLGLAGPHLLEQVRVGDALASEIEGSDLDLTLYSALPNAPYPALPQRYGRTFQIGAEMSVHSTQNDDGSLFDGIAPVYHATSSAETPDETWLHFLLAGLVRDDAPDETLRIPFRVRMRKRGDTAWRYLPELHLLDNTQSQRRFQIKLFFGSTGYTTEPPPPSARGWVEARKAAPGGDGFGAFAADAYFSAGAGFDIYRSGTENTTRVEHTVLQEYTASFYLTSAAWPAGIYDIEVIRGAVVQNNQYNSDNYTIDGAVKDFYGAPLSGVMPLSRQGILDRVTFVRSVNVKNKQPINDKNLALIHVRARNRQVDEISVIASGYVKDYVDGVGWTFLKTTSNPAPHYRNVLTGALNLDPLPEAMVWDETLIDWRQACIDNDFTCDMVVEGGDVSEVLRILASCGYASPYQSEKWGVIRDFDRSAESPVQLFTPRNMAKFEIRKAFNRLPGGLRPNFKDQDNDYSGKQILVYLDEVSNSDALTEQVEYVGITKRDKIIRRAQIDMKQMRHRNAVYSWETDAASLVCRFGSLVAVSNDVFNTFSHSGRIEAVVFNAAGAIIGFDIDATIEPRNLPDMMEITDMMQVQDFATIGQKTGVAIRTASGIVRKHKLAGSGAVTSFLTLETPITANLDEYQSGQLVAVGQMSEEYRRLIIKSVTPGKNYTATITAVDEAPEIWGS